MSDQKSKPMPLSRLLKISEIEFYFKQGDIPIQNKDIETQFQFNSSVSLATKDDILEFYIECGLIMKDTKELLASIILSTTFHLENFHEFFTPEDDGKIPLPKDIVSIFGGIALSTLRGVWYARLKGTYLHFISVPLINPNKLVANLPDYLYKDNPVK